VALARSIWAGRFDRDATRDVHAPRSDVRGVASLLTPCSILVGSASTSDLDFDFFGGLCRYCAGQSGLLRVVMDLGSRLIFCYGPIISICVSLSEDDGFRVYLHEPEYGIGTKRIL
jgi:hypothetical protein